jgi:signal transduction histidine kinase
MRKSWAQAGRELVGPLQLAAYLTWGAVLVGVLEVPRSWSWVSGAPAQGAALALMVLFLLLFLAGELLGAECQGRVDRRALALVLAQGVTVLALPLVTYHGTVPVLLIVVVAQLAALLPQRALVLVVLALNLVLYAEMRWVWQMDSALTALALFGGFQIFAAMTTLFAHRAERARAELAQVNAHLLATRSLLDESARDSERLKLARELHDVAGHKLTALKLNLAALARDPELAARSEVELVARLADELLGEIRGVVRQMRTHEGLDLHQALAQLAVPLTSMDVHFAIQPEARVDNVEQAEAILRAVQEALTNAVRHAHARSVWVELRRVEGRIVIDVRDDGRGSTGMKLGSGLTGMRERLEALGGALDVRVPDGGGFALHAWLPLKEGT